MVALRQQSRGLVRGLHALDRATVASIAKPKNRRGPTRLLPFGAGRLIASDLKTAVLRFNRRWAQFLERLNLEPANAAIDQYNRYYVLEKECVMGSPRLAARHFPPVPQLTTETLAERSSHTARSRPDRMIPTDSRATHFRRPNHERLDIMKSPLHFFERTFLAGLVVMSAAICLPGQSAAQTAADRSNASKKLAIWSRRPGASRSGVPPIFGTSRSTGGFM